MASDPQGWRKAWPENAPIYEDGKLVERAVRNAHCGRSRGVRWAHVVDAFAVGSTVAAALCRRFGLDPDDQVGIAPAMEED
jgi:hypothetical protein